MPNVMDSDACDSGLQGLLSEAFLGKWLRCRYIRVMTRTQSLNVRRLENPV